MHKMEEKIRREGKVLPGGILKVGNFLNQQIDTAFLEEMGDEIAELYEGCGVTKILTIESSGIAIAAAAGISMNVPMVFAKKHKTSNVLSRRSSRAAGTPFGRKGSVWSLWHALSP